VIMSPDHQSGPLEKCSYSQLKTNKLCFETKTYAAINLKFIFHNKYLKIMHT